MESSQTVKPLKKSNYINDRGQAMPCSDHFFKQPGRTWSQCRQSGRGSTIVLNHYIMGNLHWFTDEEWLPAKEWALTRCDQKDIIYIVRISFFIKKRGKAKKYSPIRSFITWKKRIWKWGWSR